ncbi:hypothetical protein GG344DRAFT_75084 [Lentinula edodes]|nr:hypothetical protein GG344DRAFT_75084 [Lentinula edodes]
MTETVVASLELPLKDLFPSKLQYENPPTAVGHANSIDPWIKWNLKRALTAKVHFEHQLYGPDNTYLHSVFPTARRFSVIPQALLRRVMRQGRVKDLNVSTGSTGGIHWGRDSGRSSTSVKIYPDFLIVKVFPTADSVPRKHYVVCVVEIKLRVGNEDEESQPHTAEGEAQMFGYMETLINHPYRVAELKGYLLRGTKYLEFRIVDNEVQYIPGQYQDIFAAGDPLTVHLCQIAIQEWNRRAVDGAPDNKDDDEEDGFDEFNNL